MTKKIGGGPGDLFSAGRNVNYFDAAAGARKCYHDHPALTFNGGRFVGGSCLRPAVTDCDIYVGLDAGMRVSGRQLPWTDGAEFLFPITDQRAPASADDFRRLVEYLWEALGSVRSVHVGCVGGHGRTGLVVAALAHLSGVEKPVAWTREHYCSKAVESQEQVDFLAAHHGGEPDAKPRHRSGWSKSWPGPRGREKITSLEPDPSSTTFDGRVVPSEKELTAHGDATVFGPVLRSVIEK